MAKRQNILDFMVKIVDFFLSFLVKNKGFIVANFRGKVTEYPRL